MTFLAFDPLEVKSTNGTEAALNAVKREINNILSSYVGWYDPFCELIQNSLDAVDARSKLEPAGTYEPRIEVLIDITGNSLTVSDNGVGLDQDQFRQFLAPSFSFKNGDGSSRGHKGVGATYVAYGFNYMRVTTKFPGFEASGRIRNAREWVKGSGAASNPKLEPDSSPIEAVEFDDWDRGVSVSVHFDEDTHPRRLDWLNAKDATTWLQILRIKTGLGSVEPNATIHTTIKVLSEGAETNAERIGTSYLWLHDAAPKVARFREIEAKAADLLQRFGAGRKLPDKFDKLDFIWDSWTADEILTLMESSLDEEELSVLTKHTPTVSVEFGYTAKLWSAFNSTIGIRVGQRVMAPGIQLAANNMPQGDVIQVPLVRNIGRQNQVHFLINFHDYTPDLGRKGFHRELTDFAKRVSAYLTDRVLSKYRLALRPNTGTAPDLAREMAIDNWKSEMLEHEQSEPLELESKHFFLPTERISITSAPTREQDAIALFHQLVAGGVIRGIKIMATSERFTYDGLYKVSFDLSDDMYVYDAETNPLGVSADVVAGMTGQTTKPKILEYKFSLDGLIGDLDNGDKNLNDIDLCIAWETGELWKDRFGITSLLIPENAEQRQFHGVTHTLTDTESGAKQCHLIVLGELVEFLNTPVYSAQLQREKYE